MKFIKAVPLSHYQYNAENLGFIERLLIKPRRERHGFYQRMFDEDFSRIFRSSFQQKSELFSIESNDDELKQRLFRNVKTRYSSNGVDDTVREFVEEIAQSLTFCGTAYYFLYDDPEHDELHLEPCCSSSIFRFLTVYIQLVPKRRERHWNSDDEELPRELRILDRDKLMRFHMPSSIKRMLSKQNRILDVLDKHQHDINGLSSQATHENPSLYNHFDFRVWLDTKERALYRATHEMGWNGRKYDASKRSEFFDCHRLIRFRRNQLILRDHILFQLSNELTKVGRQYNAKFHIVISPTDAMPKVAELDELEVRLSTEEASFTEVIDFCFER